MICHLLIATGQIIIISSNIMKRKLCFSKKYITNEIIEPWKVCLAKTSESYGNPNQFIWKSHLLSEIGYVSRHSFNEENSRLTEINATISWHLEILGRLLEPGQIHYVSAEDNDNITSSCRDAHKLDQIQFRGTPLNCFALILTIMPKDASILREKNNIIKTLLWEKKQPSQALHWLPIKGGCRWIQ